MDKWVFPDRITSYFKLKNRPIPIFGQYSSIPTFQQAAYKLLRDWTMRTCLVAVPSG
jgi:hypothetical protein